MKRQFQLPLLLLISLGTLAFIGAPKKKYLLEYKPSVGTSGKMIMTMDMNTSMNMSGNEMTSGQFYEMAATMNVIDANQTETTSTLDYDYVLVKMESFGMEMTYDSRDVDTTDFFGKSMHEPMSQLINTQMQVTQDRNGKTLSTEGVEGLGDQAASKAFSNTTYPDYPVGINDTWKNTVDLDDTPMKIITTYTFREVIDGKIYIDFVSEVSLNKNFEGENNIEEISGTQTGTQICILETMWMIESTIAQDINMVMMQDDVKIPMNIKSSTKIIVQ